MGKSLNMDPQSSLLMLQFSGLSVESNHNSLNFSHADLLLNKGF